MEAFREWFDRVRYDPGIDAEDNAKQYEDGAAVWRKALEWALKEMHKIDKATGETTYWYGTPIEKELETK